jgi:hypothetical protein
MTLKEWIEHVRKIDECLNIERKWYREILAEKSNLHANKPPALGTSHIPNSITLSSSSNNKPFTHLSKLTDTEKDLFQAHARCFKCHRFNAGHNSSSSSCTSFFPGAGYKTITKQADTAGQPAMKSITNSKGKVVSGFHQVALRLGPNGLRPQGLEEYSDNYLTLDNLRPVMGSKCLVMQTTGDYLRLGPLEETLERMFQVATQTFNLLYYFPFMYTH